MPLPEGRGLDTDSISKLNGPRFVAVDTPFGMGQLKACMVGYALSIHSA